MADNAHDDLLHPTLVRTNSYDQAMNKQHTFGNHHLKFKSQIWTDPAILGTTKRFEAPLRKPADHAGGYGFGVCTDKTGRHYVHRVFSGGLVEHILLENDEIEYINNHFASELNHEELASMLKAPTVDLIIRRYDDEYTDVVLERDSENISYGLQLGSKPLASDMPLESVFVSKVDKGSIADGKVTQGDFVIAINTRMVGTMSHNGALDTLAAGTKVRITCLRSDTTKKMVSEAMDGRETMLVLKRTLTKRPDDTFGFNISDFDHTSMQVIIHSKNDELVPGDMIAKVNGTNVERMSHNQVVDLIAACATEVTLELRRHVIFSNDAEHKVIRHDFDHIPNTPMTEAPDIQRQTPSIFITMERVPNSGGWGLKFGSLALNNVRKVIEVIAGSPAEKFGVKAFDEICTVNSADCMACTHDELVDMLKASDKIVLGLFRHNTNENFEANVTQRIQAASPVGGVSGGDDGDDVQVVVHQVLHEVVLERKSKDASFGIELGTDDEGHKYIKAVVQGGTADGKLLPDDKLISVNGTNVEHESHQFVVDCIMSGVNVMLTVTREGEEQNTQDIVRTYIDRKENVGIANLTKFTIEMEHSDDGYGFGIGSLRNGDVIITHVGPRAAEHLRVADVVYTINGRSVAGETHLEIVENIRRGHSLKMEVGRDADVTTGIRKEGSISRARPGLDVEFRTENNIGGSD